MHLPGLSTTREYCLSNLAYVGPMVCVLVWGAPLVCRAMQPYSLYRKQLVLILCSLCVCLILCLNWRDYILGGGGGGTLEPFYVGLTAITCLCL